MRKRIVIRLSRTRKELRQPDEMILPGGRGSQLHRRLPKVD